MPRSGPPAEDGHDRSVLLLGRFVFQGISIEVRVLQVSGRRLVDHNRDVGVIAATRLQGRRTGRSWLSTKARLQRPISRPPPALIHSGQ
jgi:hypothetical protein